MENIIEAYSKDVIKEELKKARLLKESRYGNQNIYEFNYKDSEILMNEVGRLREITFRHAGGGTGKSVDIDYYDTCEKPFSQLIIWSNNDEEIIGGYRYIFGKDIEVKDNDLKSPTGELFKFSKDFHKDITPYMVELGRSFVIPEYQATETERKGIFVLENLWIGLGAIVLQNPWLKYYFGKFTMYTQYDVFSRDLLLNFLDMYFPDKNNYGEPKKSIEYKYDKKDLQLDFTWDNYKDDYKKLVHHLKERKSPIPPLVNSYMNLSSTMQTFGTAINTHFGGVEETAILLTIRDILPAKLERYGLNHLVDKE